MNPHKLILVTILLKSLLPCISRADITKETITKQRQEKELKQWDWFAISVKEDAKQHTYQFTIDLSKGHTFSRPNEQISLFIRDDKGNNVVSCRPQPDKMNDGRARLSFTIKKTLISAATLQFYSDDTGKDAPVNTYTWNVNLGSYVKSKKQHGH